jgi:hypothetical protein
MQRETKYVTVKVFSPFGRFSIGFAIIGAISLFASAAMPWFVFTFISGSGPIAILAGMSAGISGLDLATGIWHVSGGSIPLGFSIVWISVSFLGSLTTVLVGVIGFIGYSVLWFDNTSATARVFGVIQIAAGALVIVGALLTVNQLNPLTGFFTGQSGSNSYRFSTVIGIGAVISMFFGGVIAIIGAIMALTHRTEERRGLL